MVDHMCDHELDLLLREELPAGTPPAGFVDRVMQAREQDYIRPHTPPRRYRLLSWLAASLTATTAALLAVWILVPDTVWDPRPTGLSPTLKLTPLADPSTGTVAEPGAPSDHNVPSGATKEELTAADNSSARQLGECMKFERINEPEKALVCYRQVLRTQPDNLEAYLRLQLLHAKSVRSGISDRGTHTIPVRPEQPGDSPVAPSHAASPDNNDQHEVKKLYETAYVIRNANPDEALKLLDMALDMAHPDSPYNEKITRLLERIKARQQKEKPAPERKRHRDNGVFDNPVDLAPTESAPAASAGKNDAKSKLLDERCGDTAPVAATRSLDACMNLVRKRQWVRAEACYREFLEKEPDTPDAHLRLGIVYAKIGRRKLAYREFSRFVELAPDHMKAPLVRHIIQQYEAYENTNNQNKRMHTHSQKSDKPLDDATIARTIRKYVPAMRGCAQQQLQRDPSMMGTMKISFTIQPDGGVTGVELDSPRHRDSYAFGCMTFILKRMRFPPFEGEAIRVPSIPFALGDPPSPPQP